jgi:hypothetical protein
MSGRAERAVSGTPEYELDGESNWSVLSTNRIVRFCNT